jgi:hypothetical protein
MGDPLHGAHYDCGTKTNFTTEARGAQIFYLASAARVTKLSSRAKARDLLLARAGRMFAASLPARGKQIPRRAEALLVMTIF